MQRSTQSSSSNSRSSAATDGPNEALAIYQCQLQALLARLHAVGDPRQTYRSPCPSLQSPTIPTPSTSSPSAAPYLGPRFANGLPPSFMSIPYQLRTTLFDPISIPGLNIPTRVLPDGDKWHFRYRPSINPQFCGYPIHLAEDGQAHALQHGEMTVTVPGNTVPFAPAERSCQSAECWSSIQLIDKTLSKADPSTVSVGDYMYLGIPSPERVLEDVARYGGEMKGYTTGLASVRMPPVCTAFNHPRHELAELEKDMGTWVTHAPAGNLMFMCKRCMRYQ